MAVVTLTTGVPGCGKTYVRASRFIVDYYLLETNGDYYTNFPLEIDAIIDEVFRRQKGRSKLSRLFLRGDGLRTKEDFRRRLHIIPDQVLQAWRRHESGPWEYFDGLNLVDAHIAIDEIHNFVSKRDDADKDYVKQWDDFLGEVRHRGCTFEGITQDVDQVSAVFTGRASLRLELIPCEDLRDPYFGVIMSDWYNLKASFLGTFHKTVFEVEKRKNGSGRWKVNHTRRFLIVPEYFKFYRSYEASLQDKANSGGSSLVSAPKYEYEKRTRLGLLLWFLRKNFFNLFFKFLIFGLVFWLCFGGGLTWLIRRYLDFSSSIAAANGVKNDKTIKNDNKNKKKGKKNENKSVSDESAEGEGDAEDDSVDPFAKYYETDLLGFLPALFLFSQKLVLLRNGTKVSEGYKFSPGTPLSGKTVVRIDYADRSFELDSGHVLRMRYIRPVRPSNEEKKAK